MWDFAAALPIEPEDAVTLGEGGTPLVRSEQIGAWLGCDEVWIKDESRNPTWSHKDRLNSVAVSHARRVGAKVVTVCSSGNHGASAAAYASAAGLRSVIFTLPDAPAALTAMMREYGALVVATRKFEGRWEIMREAVRRLGWYPTGNFVSPPVGGNLYGIEGLKTIAYETWQQLGMRSPDWVVSPSLLADILFGIGRGFDDIGRAVGGSSAPRLAAIERFGPITNALVSDLTFPVPVPTEHTVAISIGGGQTTYHGLRAVRQSQGVGVKVSEEEILDARQILARFGWLAEASSAAAFAGLRKLIANGTIPQNAAVVVILTSSGLKDLLELSPGPPPIPVIEPTIDDLNVALTEHYGLDIQELSS